MLQFRLSPAAYHSPTELSFGQESNLESPGLRENRTTSTRTTNCQKAADKLVSQGGSLQDNPTASTRRVASYTNSYRIVKVSQGEVRKKV